MRTATLSIATVAILALLWFGFASSNAKVGRSDAELADASAVSGSPSTEVEVPASKAISASPNGATRPAKTTKQRMEAKLVDVTDNDAKLVYGADSRQFEFWKFHRGRWERFVAEAGMTPEQERAVKEEFLRLVEDVFAIRVEAVRMHGELADVHDPADRKAAEQQVETLATQSHQLYVETTVPALKEILSEAQFALFQRYIDRDALDMVRYPSFIAADVDSEPSLALIEAQVAKAKKLGL